MLLELDPVFLRSPSATTHMLLQHFAAGRDKVIYMRCLWCHATGLIPEPMPGDCPEGDE